MPFNKPRGVCLVDGRRVFNAIFLGLVIRSAWRDLREGFGPYMLATTISFVGGGSTHRSRIIDALASAHDGTVSNDRHVHYRIGARLLLKISAIYAGWNCVRS
jgi:hypothetical protein